MAMALGNSLTVCLVVVFTFFFLFTISFSLFFEELMGEL